MGKKLLVLLLFLLCFSRYSQGQGMAGKDFWLAFMDLDPLCDPPEGMKIQTWSDDTLELYISSAFAANVHIRIEKGFSNGSGILKFFDTSFTLQPNRVHPVKVPSEVACHYPYSDGVSNNGIHVTADSLIFVKAVNRFNASVYLSRINELSKGVTAVIPTESIPFAPEYFISSNASANAWSCITNKPASKSPEFVVVGIAPVSKIEVIPTGLSYVIATDVIVGRKGSIGIPFSIVLKKGETFQFGTADDDLSGSIIRSKDQNSKFAVFSANRMTESKQLNSSNVLCKGGLDHTYEQLLPTVNWGNSYIALPFKNNYGGYYLKILAAEDSTRISINGQYIRTLKQGGFFIYNVNQDTASRITSDKRISVMQFTKGNNCNSRPGPKNKMGDISELMLIADQQFGHSAKIHMLRYGPSWWGNVNNTPEDYMNVLVKKADTSQFRINGKTVASNLWQNSSVAPAYVYAQIDVDSNKVYDLNSPKGFIAYGYGYGTNEGYAYSAGENFGILQNNFTFSTQCRRDTVVFTRVKNDSFSNYSWTLGDNSGTKTGTLVKHIYTDTGWMRAVMYCRHLRTNALDSVTKNIYISPESSFPNVLGPDTMICGKVDFALYAKNLSYDNIYAWWNGHPNYGIAIKKAGQYWLKITERNGCSSIDTINVTNFQYPFANFALSDTTICLNRNRAVNFTNLSTAIDSIAVNTWKFGDTTLVDNAHIAKHQYKTPGNYVVKLTVRTINGCEDDTFRSLTLSPAPRASFVITDKDSCFNGNYVNFVNTTVIDSLHKNFRWFFSEGFFLFNDNPGTPWTYAAPGKYTALLVYENTYKCLDSMKKEVMIYNHPKSGFSLNHYYQCINDNVRFTNKTTSAYVPVKSYWDFGDMVTDTLINPFHTYTVSGTYTAKLISESPQGCKDSITSVIRVYNPPFADFTVNDSFQCLSGNRFLLKNISSTDTGKFTSVLWRCDDSTKDSNKDNVSKSFLYPGKHSVNLKVINMFGCSDSTSRTVEAKKGPGVAFKVNDASQCFNGHGFNLDYVPVSGNGTITGMKWYYNNDSSINTSSVNNIRYPATGKYPVRLKLFDSDGCSGEATRTVFVNPEPLAKMNILSPAQCFNGHSFNFTDQSTIPSGTLLGFNWNFGDMSNSTVQNPVNKTYGVAGIYQVLLTVTSDSGCTDTAMSSLEIYPNANIIIPAIPAVCLNDSAVFNANATVGSGSITAYQWDFGDMQVSNQANTKHLYSSPGVYSVTLSTTTDKNCKDSKTASNWVTVHALPVPDFKYKTLDGGNNKTTVSFSDITQPKPKSLLWNFGQFGQSTKTDTSFSIRDSITVLARLYVTDQNGCTGMTEKYIFLAPPSLIFFPTAFSPNKDGHNEGFGPVGILFATNYTFKVFNRWGEMVYASDTPGETWDGNYQEKVCPNGLYYFHVELNDFNGIYKSFDGMVMLMR